MAMQPTADTTYGPSATSMYFASINPLDMFNVKPQSPSLEAEVTGMPGLARATGPGAHAPAPLWSPENPLFWFAGVLAATFGLVFVSTSIRVGPVRAGASIGKK